MKAKVFYIEDEKHLGKIVQETLMKQGYEVLWESDGAQVMIHLHGSFNPDICVLDIMLPHVDGEGRIRKRHRALPRPRRA